MDAKTWLDRANKIDERILSKRQQIQRWQEHSNGLVQSYMHGSRSGHSDRVSSYACKCVDMEDKIGRALRELVDTKIEITNKLQEVKEPLYLLILENRYLLGKRWETIAEELSYDCTYIRELHSKALSNFAKILD